MNGPAPITDKRAGLRAWLVTEENMNLVAEWVGGEVRSRCGEDDGIWFLTGDECCCGEEPQEDAAFPGNYIVETRDGRFECWYGDAFLRNYELSGSATTIN